MEGESGGGGNVDGPTGQGLNTTCGEADLRCGNGAIQSDGVGTRSLKTGDAAVRPGGGGNISVKRSGPVGSDCIPRATGCSESCGRAVGVPIKCLGEGVSAEGEKDRSGQEAQADQARQIGAGSTQCGGDFRFHVDFI